MKTEKIRETFYTKIRDLTQENIIPLQYVEFLFTKIKQANVTTKSNSSRSNKLF